MLGQEDSSIGEETADMAQGAPGRPRGAGSVLSVFGGPAMSLLA